MKKEWTKPKLISLYRGRPQEAVLNACKVLAIESGPAVGGEPPEVAGDCEVGSGVQCYDISTSQSVLAPERLDIVIAKFAQLCSLLALIMSVNTPCLVKQGVLF